MWGRHTIFIYICMLGVTVCTTCLHNDAMSLSWYVLHSRAEIYLGIYSICTQQCRAHALQKGSPSLSAQ